MNSRLRSLALGNGKEWKIFRMGLTLFKSVIWRVTEIEVMTNRVFEGGRSQKIKLEIVTKA